jgi:DNA-binding GntR family transcriptional regulator
MKSAKKTAYENLRYRIIIQDLPPGELLKEKELMRHYSIGRTPLRDIFIELQREGLIKRVPRAGTWVAPMDIRFLKQTMEIRIELEGLAGELAVERISDKQIEKLDEIIKNIDEIELKENMDEDLLRYESTFHSIIYSATCNPKLEEMLSELQSVCARFWHHLFFSKNELAELFENQRSMLEALKKKDKKKCRQIMREHMPDYSKIMKGHKISFHNNTKFKF